MKLSWYAIMLWPCPLAMMATFQLGHGVLKAPVSEKQYPWPVFFFFSFQLFKLDAFTLQNMNKIQKKLFWGRIAELVVYMKLYYVWGNIVEILGPTFKGLHSVNVAKRRLRMYVFFCIVEQRTTEICMPNLGNNYLSTMTPDHFFFNLNIRFAIFFSHFR